MNLYNKYRPQSIDQVVGNEETVGYLKSMFKKAEYPSAFLLAGPTGCGKTTLGRIIAKEMGCDEIDFKEINTADMRGIDTIRELIRSSRYQSIGGDVRVWMIDESHKMTNDAQNALLKLLEDPPPSAHFILCTTEPNKLIQTIRGRCVKLDVHSLHDHQMFSLLRGIVKAEEAKIGKSVYEQIIRDSLGLPRNAIQILEKVLAVPSDQQLKVAKESAAEYSQSIELCRALLEGSGWKKVSRILNGLEDQEAESVRRHVLGYCRSVLLKKENDRAAFIIEQFWEPFYDIGQPGLVYACYAVSKS